jgi:hypothetical protein
MSSGAGLGGVRRVIPPVTGSKPLVRGSPLGNSSE